MCIICISNVHHLPPLSFHTEGPDEEPNDTYVEQLTSSARAAVDELVRRGVADPQRVAVGGHSYGVCVCLYDGHVL